MPDTTRHAPAVRLTRGAPATAAARTWPEDVRPLFESADDAHGWQPWQVLGSPGTGKTALLTDLAVERIAAGADPESVLVLTHSRVAATSVRAAVTAGLFARRGATGTTREPLVRTVHSYAFAVLRLQAAVHGNPPPRLMTGAEQDAVIREMLAGEVADGATQWPERLRGALGMAGFAAELRDFMLRAGERGLGPEDVVRLGRRHNKPEWVAAGKFAIRYEQATLLRWSVGVETPEASAPALDAAELVGAALNAFATDADLVTREHARVRWLLVDDAQHLDPQAADLVRLIGTGTARTVVAGDPDQAIFAFRGAEPTFVTDLADAGSPLRIVLSTNHRSAAAPAGLATRIAARLPGLGPHRGAHPAPGAADGTVRIEVLPSVAREAAAVADHLRRAHLNDGVPWSQMAVLMRSVPWSIAPLRRALAASGVPTTTAATELPLARQRGAAWLLLVLRAIIAADAFDTEDGLALLAGPLGGADPVALRRLRRGLRRTGAELDSAEMLRAAIVDDLSADTEAAIDGLTDVEAAPLRRVLDVVAHARAPHREARGIEDVLWATWQASSLERRWSAASLRGGPGAVQADRDLDAVVALFDAAAAYVDRLPRAGVEGFVTYVEHQALPGERRPRACIARDAVELLSAHSAAGREWRVVAVVGVQEGLWPSLRARGTLLGTEHLVELTAGIRDGDEPLSRTAPLLAEERRLLLLACSRARTSLLVTAVESAAGDRDLVPSRFVDELRVELEGHRSDGQAEPTPTRVLALEPLVAELRAVVCDPHADPERRGGAARHLARLGRAGVPGAHPDEWYGLGGVSTDTAIRASGPVRLSPSTVEQLRTCPLRWALERHGGSDGDNVHAIKGNLVHTLLQAVAGDVPEASVRAALDDAWRAVDVGSDWHSRLELRRTAAMLDTFTAWLRASRVALTLAGVEVVVDCLLPGRTDDEPDVRIRGRIDRLERDPDGRAVIVDIKTGKNPVTAKAAQEHAQLATYQVAAAHGGIPGEGAAAPGGGRLVYVAKSHRNDGATQRNQSALDANELAAWRDTIHAAAAATAGPGFLAIRNDGCRHCPVATSCPAHDAGRQVTDG
ncbi:MAG TPA: ATP-dependent DNA helicase [Aldersonia sp.]